MSSPNRRLFTGRDGLRLVADTFGEPDPERARPPVVLLHGGGQTRHAWGRTGKVLAESGFCAIALDTRGHGESDWDPDGDYSATAMVDDLVLVVDELVDEFGTAPALVGASMGGGASIMLEGERERSAPAAALVLVDAGTHLEMDGAMKIKGFMESAPDGFASLEHARDAIAAYLPHRPPPNDLDGLRKNLRLGEDGRWRWHWDPRFVAGGKAPIELIDVPRLDRAARHLEMPVLLVRGKLSDVISEESARHLLGVVPHAEYVDITDAGHMVAGDKNDMFGEAVVGFLTRTLRPGP